MSAEIQRSRDKESEVAAEDIALSLQRWVSKHMYTKSREMFDRTRPVSVFRTNFDFSFICFCLSNLAYWVGFGSVITFKTHL